METRLALFLALAVAISGCADNSKTTEVGLSSGKGLEIESLGVADDTLAPGQQTTLSLTLKNYHAQDDVEITDLSVFNNGQIRLLNEEPNCNPSTIQRASEGFAPEMVCTWTLKAPSGDTLGAFKSKPMPVNVRIEYKSSIINSEPLKLQFKPPSKIESVEPIENSFSNGEVKASMEVESPASTQGGRMIHYDVQNTGPGKINGSYSFEYTPESIFEDCVNNHVKESPVIDSEVEFSCQVQNDVEAVRNLFTSISYKYVKTPTVDIEVVNR